MAGLALASVAGRAAPPTPLDRRATCSRCSWRPVRRARLLAARPEHPEAPDLGPRKGRLRQARARRHGDRQSARPTAAGPRRRGTFDRTHETVLRNQIRGDNVGVEVLTPLRLADGTAVLVDRGWVQASSRRAASPPIRRLRGPPSCTDSCTIRTRSARTTPSTIFPTAGSRCRGSTSRRSARTMPYKLRPVWIEAQAISPAPHRQRARAPAATAARSREPHGVRDRMVRVRADPAHRLADRAAAPRPSAQRGDERQHREHREQHAHAQSQRTRREPAQQSVTADHRERGD